MHTLIIRIESEHPDAAVVAAEGADALACVLDGYPGTVTLDVLVPTGNRDECTPERLSEYALTDHNAQEG